MKDIYILTYSGVFSQDLKPWSSLDVNLLTASLAAKGLSITPIEYADALKLPSYTDHIFITSSSQNPTRKRLIDDICYELNMRGSVIIPNLDLLRAHDNKGYQVLLSERLNIIKPIEAYFLLDHGTFRCISDKNYVIKTIDGASSNGVALVNSKKDLRKFFYKNLYLKHSFPSIFKAVKQKLKAFIKPSSYCEAQRAFYETTISCVKQNFIAGLTFDYKVIVFYDEYYVLKRNIKKDDFRASGSNNFELLDHVSEDVLSFAKNTFDKLSAPYLSIDIVEKSGELFVLEFQGPHFGPYTVLTSRVFYKYNNGNWEKHSTEKRHLECIYADALSKFINEAY